ncbi:alpha/beta hydrolase [Candidatus Uhrbacteria bacterium]|nr:alpha/beta hydrolase [Candidatus Uhrbacteria bacterium]
MSSHLPILVLFPGFWGNKTTEIVQWWFSLVILYFQRNYEIVLITYEGHSIKDFVASAGRQTILLKQQRRPIYAIGYSTGAQIIRGIEMHAPGTFSKVVLLSGVENFGVRFTVFVQSLRAVFWPLLRSVVLGPLVLDQAKYIERLFLGRTRNEKRRGSFIAELLKKYLHPEDRRAVFQIATPGLRVRYPGLKCPTLVIIPEGDFFAADATYEADNVYKRLSILGDHSVYVHHSNALTLLFGKIARFFRHQT